MRIFKRPMFRKGGSTSQGIMTGLTDRKQYQEGTPSPREDRIRTRSEEDLAILNRLAPMSTNTGLDDLGGMTGLNILSNKYAGGTFLENVAGSATDPYKDFIKGSRLRDAQKDQRNAAAVAGAIGQERARELALIKARASSNMQKDFSADRKYFELYKEYTKEPKNAFSKTIRQIYPGSMAEFASKIQMNAASSEKGQKALSQVLGVVPHNIKGGVAEFDYGKMNSGGLYFHPGLKVFVQRTPAAEGEDSGKLITYDPYTFVVIKEQTFN